MKYDGQQSNNEITANIEITVELGNLVILYMQKEQCISKGKTVLLAFMLH